jgi:superfamily II DNA or RNA helicase
VRFFLTRGQRRERATGALADLEVLVAWAERHQIDGAFTEALSGEGLEWPPAEDVWADVQARPRIYYDALAAMLQASPSAAANDHFLEAEVVRKVARLCDLGPRVIDAEEYLRQQVKDSFTAVRDQMVRRDLTQMPIARVKDTTSGRLRLKTLESAGFAIVQDVLSVSVARLQAVDGVGAQTAMQVHAAAKQLAAAVSDDLKFRIDLDPSNELNTALLTALHRWGELRRPVAGLEEDVAAASDDLAPLKGAYLPPRGLVGFFAGRSSGGRLTPATVREWASWVTRHAERLDQAESALRAQPVPAQQVWRDFERRSADYYALLAQVVDLKLDTEATHGYLPDDVVARVQAQDLDGSLARVSFRGYQAFGARFALAQERVIIGDEMGLGKTIQAIAAMAHCAANGQTHVLVVCPASVLINWMREVAERSALRPMRLHGPDREYNLKEWRRRGGVAVTTFAATRRLDLGESRRLGILVVDEAHYVKNPSALRSKAVARLARRADRTLFLTGTPMENRLEEFENLIGYLQPELLPAMPTGGARSSAAFRRRVAPVYLRRNQEDVLAELPDLVQVEEWEEFGRHDFEAYRKAVRDGNFMAMRRAAFAVPAHSAKLRRLVQIADEARDNGHKVIVFSYFRDVLETVHTALGDRAFGPLTGSVTATQRQDLVDAFSRAKGHAVLVSQIRAGGVGLNMQAGSVVILCEPQVTPTMEAQAIARAHRMGQVRSVQVHRLLTADSVDQRMVEMLGTKARLFEEYARHSHLADSAPEAVDISEAALAKTVVEQEQERLALQVLAEVTAGGTNA